MEGQAAGFDYVSLARPVRYLDAFVLLLSLLLSIHFSLHAKYTRFAHATYYRKTDEITLNGKAYIIRVVR